MKDDSAGPFVRFKGRLYYLGDFASVRNNADSPLANWHAFLSETFFSGLVVRYTSADEVIVGSYTS